MIRSQPGFQFVFLPRSHAFVSRLGGCTDLRKSRSEANPCGEYGGHCGPCFNHSTSYRFDCFWRFRFHQTQNGKFRIPIKLRYLVRLDLWYFRPSWFGIRPRLATEYSSVTVGHSVAWRAWQRESAVRARERARCWRFVRRSVCGSNMLDHNKLPFHGAKIPTMEKISWEHTGDTPCFSWTQPHETGPKWNSEACTLLMSGIIYQF